MLCEKCGAQSPEGSRFCAACGAPLAINPASSRPRSRILTVGGPFLAVCGILGSIGYLVTREPARNSNHSKPTAEGEPGTRSLPAPLVSPAPMPGDPQAANGGQKVPQAKHAPEVDPASAELEPRFVELSVSINTAGGFQGNSLFNRQTIRGVRIYKNRSEGILRIEVALATKQAGPLGEVEAARITAGGKFLVRLFDENGAFITYFVTSPPAYDWPKRADHRYQLDFPVNQRDLQFATQAEFGIIAIPQ